MASASTSGGFKPSCKYGPSCYRMNATHLQSWDHPHLKQYVNDFTNRGKFPSSISDHHKKQVDILLKQDEAWPITPQLSMVTNAAVDLWKRAMEYFFQQPTKPPIAHTKDGAADCPICLESATEGDWTTLNKCGHGIHVDCLNKLKGQGNGGFKCPNCNKIYGELTGSQPEGGTVKFLSHPGKTLSGYEHTSTGTLELQFDFPVKYGADYVASGFPKSAFLPDTPEGHSLAQRLQLAFKRNLLFTVGMSMTTGRDNRITFNDIHLKTTLKGPHGYPDSNYLVNLASELSAKGIDAPDAPAATSALQTSSYNQLNKGGGKAAAAKKSTRKRPY